MKNFKKKIATIALASGLALGTTTMTTQKAEAGIIIGLASAGVAGPVIGLGIAAAGFFWGIQSEGLNWAAGALFILDEDQSGNGLRQLVSTRYPELESYAVDEIVALALKNAENGNFNQQGLKEITISSEELAPVLEMIATEQPELAKKIAKDLTTATL